MAMILWTHNFVEAQGYGVYKHILYQDNNSAILLKNNNGKSVRKHSRHLNIMYFFVTDVLEKGKLTIQHCPTLDMITDYMKKPPQGAKILQFMNDILGM